MDKAAKRLEKLKESVDDLKDILDTENYGMCIVDAHGNIVKWNYERLFGISEEEVLGKPVENYLENTRLNIIVKTGEKELYQLQTIGDANVIANRVPIYYEGEIIGAAGTIIFKDTKEIGDLFARMEKAEHNYFEYRSELAKMYKARYTFDDIKSNDPHMERLKDIARTVARTEVTILIQGESGTGKELFAHAIHQVSSVSHEPFVSINCASIPKELIESELFGYEGGAFTGSRREGKMGKFELAGVGTIFLDEVGSMPLDMQAKLLRVLESHEFERVGGNKKIPFNARVVAATNEDMMEAVRQHRFRSDLFYRLNVVNLEILPLRQHLDDIGCLSEAVLERRRKKYDLGNIRLSRQALEALKYHSWPGNVRELRNVIERAMVLCEDDEILPEHLPEYILDSCPNLNVGVDEADYFHKEIEKLERRLIEKALKESDGNKIQAAKRLGIHRSLLYKKMKDYHIEEFVQKTDKA